MITYELLIMDLNQKVVCDSGFLIILRRSTDPATYYVAIAETILFSATSLTAGTINEKINIELTRKITFQFVKQFCPINLF